MRLHGFCEVRVRCFLSSEVYVSGSALNVDAQYICASPADKPAGRSVTRYTGDFYLTGGFRRLAFKYDVTLGTFPRFERKPGVWAP